MARTALVTGGSRGIGAAAKRALEARGARVVGQATKTDSTDMVAADFCEPGAPQELWQTALARAGGSIDVLVNNAGLFFAVRHWQERGVAGRIVHVASRAGHRGDSPAHWHYAAAKGGMLAMHKTIARAYAGEGILSFAITPGFTDTAMAGDYLESRGGPGLLADIPLGRVAEPEEIATLIAFCALDAPASMTGATLDANGASYVR